MIRTALAHKKHMTMLGTVDMRERYNALKDLTPQRAVELYQAWRDGRYADPQLCFDALEEYDDMLGTLIDRRLSALEEMSGSVKISSGITEDRPDLQKLAEEQQQFLAAEYDRIVNLMDAVSWLGMATFRGYSHLEIMDYGDKVELVPSDQWFWHRPHRRGPWAYNPTANPTHGDLYDADMHRLIVRSVDRPVNIVAMFAITVKAHGEAGWDGFIDVFGNPALFFEYPPNTSDEKAKEYDEIMEYITGDGRGGYPSGGKIVPVESTVQGGDTFRERCDWINKKMVYRATGGLLTVLAESGSGTLAGSAHMTAFRQLAQAESAKITEVLNRQYSDRLLDFQFPGQPKLAYWTLESQDTDNTAALTQAIATLASVGYRVADEQVSELTGLNVTSANMDSTAIYAAKAAGYVPTQTALQSRMGMPLQPAPQIEQGSPGAPGPVITNRLALPAPPAADSTPLTADEIAALADVLKWTPASPESPGVAQMVKTLTEAAKAGRNEKTHD